MTDPTPSSILIADHGIFSVGKHGILDAALTLNDGLALAPGKHLAGLRQLKADCVNDRNATARVKLEHEQLIASHAPESNVVRSQAAGGLR